MYNQFGGNRGGYRRTRRGGVSKPNQNNRKLNEALQKLKQMDELQAKVNALELERKKALEEDEKKKAAEQARIEEEQAAEKARIEEELQNKKVEELVAKAFEAAKKKEEEDEENCEVCTKKPWYSWFMNW